MRFFRPKMLGRTGLAVVGLLVAAACGEPADAPDQAAAHVQAGGPLTIAEPWVKAAPDGMTAAFGVLANPGDDDVRVVAAESPDAAMVELHEVVMVDGELKMREIDGGIVVPAGGERVLEPGGDHLMLMDPVAAIQPGDEVSLVLELEDGSTVEFTAQAKEFGGADEDYVPGGHDDHDR